MRQKWKDFAQRRKINIEMFNTMSYQDYSKWCEIRRVEPISKESYEGVQSLLQKTPTYEPVIEATESSSHEFDEMQLKKMRKGALVDLCKEFQVEVATADTKRSLIEKLLTLNNQ
tara:strand:+ start:204 stop:548 length:345 start_codon:yes stop_codon:yes gene_type:complete